LLLSQGAVSRFVVAIGIVRDATPWRSPARQLCGDTKTLFLDAQRPGSGSFRDREMFL
jgi:hypothetical protein